VTRRILPTSQWPGDDDFSHLKFALKYEGLDLPLLRAVLPKLKAKTLEAAIRAEPLGSYARRIWYLYESLAKHGGLDIPDLVSGNYVPLIDPIEYFTGPVRRVQRQRVAVNLLGDMGICAFVRRTPVLDESAEDALDARCRQIIAGFAPEIFERALDFLYRKETRSSFAIERETPDRRRAEEFVRLLQEAGRHDYLQRDALVALQNAIVDPRYANPGWRDSLRPPEQNFVAGRGAPNVEGVHYIPPRPEEIGKLMKDWLAFSRRVLDSDAPPIVAAAVIAWTFVFLHPFSDGNGRIHRFLIHHVLARRGFGPKGVIFPVSAAMLDEPRAYDASLEAFSHSLMPLLDWWLDDDRNLHVRHDSSDRYRSIDCTAMAEALFAFVKRTIERDLPAELAFLRGYDAARAAMRTVVDLPGPDADRFIQFCKQNGWRLSAAKRRVGGLARLTDEEIVQLEAAVRKAFATGQAS